MSKASERLTGELTRRRVLALAGATTAAGLGVHASTQRAQAAVQTDSFSVPDDTYAAADGSLYSPRVAVDASWSYEGADAADTVMTALLFDGGLALSETQSDVAAPSDSGTTTLAAPVVDSRAWDSEQWQPPADGEVSHEVVTEIRLEVRSSSGETLASASASDAAVITVRDGGPTTAASLGGSGDVSFLESEDGTPQG